MNFSDHNLQTYYGLTMAQVDRLPIYLFDAMRSALTELKDMHAKLDRAEGIKPVPHGECYTLQSVVVVDTDEGDYAFPFTKRGYSSVTFRLPKRPGRLPRSVTVSFDERKDEKRLEVYANGGQGMMLRPTSANTFSLTLD
jgi:hypothetical protein